MADRINVLLIGGGGREHALALRLAESPRLGKLWITHGQNPGLAALGTPFDVPVSIREIYRLVQFCDRQEIGLVVIGPEGPLAEGYADRLRTPNRLVFGPGAEGARLEADKAWCKQLLRGASVPTGEARAFSDAEQARTYIESRAQTDTPLAAVLAEASRYRDAEDRRAFIRRRVEADRALQAVYAAADDSLPVIKAAGLAAGKGVVLPRSLGEAIATIDAMMVRRVFGDSGRTILIEERLEGPEASVFALVDGSSIFILETCQDHKRLGDGDTGPNTGGMGAFCPSPLVDDAMMGRIQRDILVPTVDALRREGIDYRGVLYAGLMLTPAGPKVLEYNVRFGDPECQALMARLESDLLELMLATCRGTLADAEVRWRPGASCCVVLASAGYPDKPLAGVPIEGVEQAAAMPGVTVTHAGTAVDAKGRLVTAGGRVLNVTAIGDSLGEARRLAYAAAECIRFQGRQMRTDIGRERDGSPPGGTGLQTGA